ncbi:MAG: tRNA (guanine(37)-N1)-methyltransferase Trm5a [Methanoregulaceae archaeon PtaU1.Bin059]|nr:MAG: tRNA (guanine(37)-N1)-methyltransferase Trm5a [Methanoregulaceae archaeon PtaB.Bin152]OPY40707.1 MAG: tRNA (guanine(37)-N1)-methyltransferase Trm5a [Methanoregulaceae archaeon PtaU1.Bin059]
MTEPASGKITSNQFPSQNNGKDKKCAGMGVTPGGVSSFPCTFFLTLATITWYPTMTLKDDLRGVLPPEVAEMVPRGFQVIGDIAVILLPPELHEFRHMIAAAILSRHRNVHTVASREQIPRGDSRVADLEVIAGIDRTITLYREYGFCYRLDVKSTFFSARLASERRRVWMQVKPWEEVLVPYAGVGPFAIPPASRGAIVTAVEKNPLACRFLRQNVSLNRVEGRIFIHEGDVSKVLSEISVEFDRAIIPAPYGHDQALFSLLPVVREGGAINFYTFKRASQVPAIQSEYERAGLEVRSIRKCGYVAPGIARYAFDMVKRRK